MLRQGSHAGGGTEAIDFCKSSRGALRSKNSIFRRQPTTHCCPWSGAVEWGGPAFGVLMLSARLKPGAARDQLRPTLRAGGCTTRWVC